MLKQIVFSCLMIIGLMIVSQKGQATSPIKHQTIPTHVSSELPVAVSESGLGTSSGVGIIIKENQIYG